MKTIEELRKELGYLKAKQEIGRIGQEKASERVGLQREINAMKYGGIFQTGKNIKGRLGTIGKNIGTGIKNVQKSPIGTTFKRISVNAAKSQRNGKRNSNPFGINSKNPFGF